MFSDAAVHYIVHITIDQLYEQSLGYDTLSTITPLYTVVQSGTLITLYLYMLLYPRVCKAFILMHSVSPHTP